MHHSRVRSRSDLGVGNNRGGKTMMYGPWDEFRRHMTTLEPRVQKAMSAEIGRLALEYAKEWKGGIRNKTLGLLPNRPLTAKAKGSSTPLVDHRDLLRAIHARKMGDVWFIGILKSAKTTDGDSLENIAKVLEYGTIKPIRPKRAKWLCIPVTKKASRVGSPRDFDGALIFINNEEDPGSAILMDENGEVHYVLLKKVSIRARPSMRTSWTIFQPRAIHRCKVVIAREVTMKRTGTH